MGLWKRATDAVARVKERAQKNIGALIESISDLADTIKNISKPERSLVSPPPEKSLKKNFFGRIKEKIKDYFFGDIKKELDEMVKDLYKIYIKNVFEGEGYEQPGRMPIEPEYYSKLMRISYLEEGGESGVNLISMSPREFTNRLYEYYNKTKYIYATGVYGRARIPKGTLDIRRIQGLQTSYVDFTYTGALKRSVKVYYELDGKNIKFIFSYENSPKVHKKVQDENYETAKIKDFLEVKESKKYDEYVYISEKIKSKFGKKYKYTISMK